MANKRRFSAQAATIQRDLRNVIEKMKATTLRINQDILKGDVEIVFDRSGRRYVFRCSKYPHSADNLRAAQLAITYLWRALEEYGVTSDDEEIEQVFSQFFLGFEATPDDTVLLLTDGGILALMACQSTTFDNTSEPNGGRSWA